MRTTQRQKPLAGDPKLRKRAEDWMERAAGEQAQARERTAMELAHELLVHQVELELQNEELHQSQLAAEIARDRYADLYNLAPVAFFTLSHEALIIEANLAAAELLGVARSALPGRSLINFLAPGDHAACADYLLRVRQSPGKQGCELTLHRRDGCRLDVRVDSVCTVLADRRDENATILLAVSDISKLRQAERERAAHAERLNELSRNLELAQENDRKRLSSEIHDRTSPNLVALKLNLATITRSLHTALPGAIEALVADAIALIDDTTASLREISTELRPPVLDYTGLLPAIQSAANQLSQRTGIKVVIDGHRFLRRPEPAKESTLFRIVNEALTNCAKHARARTIHVYLANEGSQVVLDIEDDGVGFDAAGQAASDLPGLGLITMRERAEFAGGTFSIESAPGRGTRIEVLL